jgi:macrodomain Ter protein organizer (MatP/YcbG family)
MPRERMRPKAIRVPDALWQQAQEKADERGEVLSEEIRKFLERYVKRQGKADQ